MTADLCALLPVRVFGVAIDGGGHVLLAAFADPLDAFHFAEDKEAGLREPGCLFSAFVIAYDTGADTEALSALAPDVELRGGVCPYATHAGGRGNDE